MNTRQAKAEPLPEFLARLGCLPVQVRGNDVWYRSPFRPGERTASFKIDRVKNVWYDHGAGQGGTIIDLVGEIHGTTDVGRILTIIADTLGEKSHANASATNHHTGATNTHTNTKASSQIELPNSTSPILELPPIITKPKDTPEIESVGEIVDPILEAYIAERGISIDLARLYLKEVFYRVGKSAYKTLGFANDKGGYEIRNATFKGTLGKKDITSIPKENAHTTAVFEGFFDFLSILTHYQRDQGTGNVLILNSLSLLDRGIGFMESRDTNHIHAYLDHDTAGTKAMTTLAERGAWKITDHRDIYQGYKDANELIA